MKRIAPLLCALALGSLSAFGATSAPTIASFAGHYKATVSAIQLADDSEAFVGGLYRNFKITIKRGGRGTGKAIYYSPDGTTATPVRIKLQLSKFKTSGGAATAEVVGIGNDGLVFLGTADLKSSSRKRNILFTFVKGNFHSFALFVSR